VVLPSFPIAMISGAVFHHSLRGDDLCLQRCANHVALRDQQSVGVRQAGDLLG
jgi:hypothetical protein